MYLNNIQQNRLMIVERIPLILNYFKVKSSNTSKVIVYTVK